MSDEPATLHDLLDWFRVAWNEEIPSRLHARRIEEWDALGGPQWHVAFRGYLLSEPDAVDQDGTIRRPLRAHLAHMARSGGHEARRAELLFRLAVLDFDPIAAHRRGRRVWRRLTDEAAETAACDHCEVALRHLWRRSRSEPHRFLSRRDGVRIDKSESQHRAEEAAR